MLQLKPGDYIVKADGTPCEVRSLRWQLTENGEAAIAVLRTFTESIGVETIFLHIDECEGQPEGEESTKTGAWCSYRTFLAKDVTMADAATVARIQEQLSRQREMMKVMITEQVHMPSMGKAGAGSTRGHAGQLERAKQKRAAAKEAMELTLLALMEKHSCGRQEAKDLLEKMAGL
jgi:hypothetical protein